jgi:hypothetical protein
MTEPKSSKSILGFRKSALEAELLAIAPEQMQEYIETCAALSGIEKLGVKHEISSTEFMPYKNAIDAIEVYLDKLGEFTDQEAIVEALVKGGFSPLDKHRERSINDSIRYHLRYKKRIKMHEGKLGRIDWEP